MPKPTTLTASDQTSAAELDAGRLSPMTRAREALVHFSAEAALQGPGDSCSNLLLRHVARAIAEADRDTLDMAIAILSRREAT